MQQIDQNLGQKLPKIRALSAQKMSGKETEKGPKEAPKLEFESTKMEEKGALVPYKKDTPKQDTPRDMAGLGSPIFRGQNDPTQSFELDFPGSTGVLARPPLKEREHGPRGRSSEIFGTPTFADLSQFEVSPEILKLLKGAEGMLGKFESSGDRHSDVLQIEGPRENEPRKHGRETPSESGSPPTKRVHDESSNPLEEDTPHFSELGPRESAKPNAPKGAFQSLLQRMMTTIAPVLSPEIHEEFDRSHGICGKFDKIHEIAEEIDCTEESLFGLGFGATEGSGAPSRIAASEGSGAPSRDPEMLDPEMPVGGGFPGKTDAPPICPARNRDPTRDL